MRYAMAVFIVACNGEVVEPDAAPAGKVEASAPPDAPTDDPLRHAPPDCAILPDDAVDSAIDAARVTRWTVLREPATHSLFSVNFGHGRFVATNAGGILTSEDGVRWTSRWKSGGTWSWGVTAFGGGRFVVAAEEYGSDLIEHGRLLSSIDGTCWTSVAVDHPLLDVIFGAGRFVAVGYHGLLLTSGDGLTWSRRDTGTTEELGAVLYTGSQFLAYFRDSASALISTNGLRWTHRAVSLPAANGPRLWTPICAMGTCFAGGLAGQLRSSDGVTWALDPTAPPVTSLAYVGRLFIGMGFDRELYTSSDGQSWDMRYQASHAGKFHGAAYGNRTYVAVGSAGSVRSGDGVTWSGPDARPRVDLRAVAFGHGIFAGVGDDGVSTTVDGRTWSNAILPRSIAGLADIVYADSGFAAVGYDIDLNDAVALSSVDGRSWQSTKLPGPIDVPAAVTYGAGAYLALGSDPSRHADVAVRSVDGTTWTGPFEVGRAPQCLRSVIYGATKFVAVGDRCLASSTDGMVWRSDDLDARRWTSVAFGAGRFVAVGESIQTSTDGVSWSDVTALDIGFAPVWLDRVVYTGTHFVAVGCGVVLTSHDGLSWSAVALAYRDDCLLGVSRGGTITLAVGLDIVMRSLDRAP